MEFPEGQRNAVKIKCQSETGARVARPGQDPVFCYNLKSHGFYNYDRYFH